MRFVGLILFAGFFCLAGCDQAIHEETLLSSNHDTSVDDYYAEHPDFFIFSEPDKIPNNLIWQDGLNETEFANIDAPKGGTLHVAIADFPKTLRAVGPDSNSGLRAALYDTNTLSLIDIHPNTLAYIPSLAEFWAQAHDQRTVYFRLNPRACYNDGTPIRTGDFFYTFYFMRSPHIQAPFYNNWYTEEFACITRYDDFTFSVTLKNKSPDPIWYANLAPTPRHYYGALKPDYPQRYQWSFPPTTGAYEVRPNDIVKGRKVITSRVEDWWAAKQRYYRGRYNVDKIIYRVVRDETKTFELFRKGELDIMDLTLPEYWYKKSQIPEVKKGYIERTIFYNDVPRPMAGLYLNETAGILKDPNVRKGIAYSLALDTAIQTYFHGDYKRLRTCAEGYGPYTSSQVSVTPFAPEKAEEAFALAGFKKRGQDGILINETGKRLSFTLTLMSGPLQEVYTLLQDEARKAGLEILLEPLDPLTAYGKFMSKNHEAAALAWSGGFSLKPEGYWASFHSENALKDGTNNVTCTADPLLDTLIDRYDETENEVTAQELSRGIQEKVAERYAYLPTWYCPYYRVGYWRWLCFPKDFDVQISESPLEYGLYWINEPLKDETLKALKQGHGFAETTHVYNQERPAP